MKLQYSMCVSVGGRGVGVGMFSEAGLNNMRDFFLSQYDRHHEKNRFLYAAT